MSGFTQHSGEIDSRGVAHHLHPLRGPSTPAHPAGMVRTYVCESARSSITHIQSHKRDFSCETVDGCSENLRIRKVPENAGIFVHHISFLSTEIITSACCIFCTCTCTCTYVGTQYILLNSLSLLYTAIYKCNHVHF